MRPPLMCALDVLFSSGSLPRDPLCMCIIHVLTDACAARSRRKSLILAQDAAGALETLLARGVPPCVRRFIEDALTFVEEGIEELQAKRVAA